MEELEALQFTAERLEYEAWEDSFPNSNPDGFYEWQNRHVGDPGEE